MNAFDFSSLPGSDSRPGPVYRRAGDSDAIPCVTVITPFFNAGTEFEQTAASMLHQTLQNFEWILINDGSTATESMQMAENLARQDERIRLISHAENRGLPAARNTGFHHARTSYVFQLDSDDLIEPTTLEKCRWFLESYPACAFVKGWTVGFGAKEYADYYKSFENVWDFFQNNPVTATAMIKKEVHRNVGGYDASQKSGLEDWDFWLKCAQNGYWGATIFEHLDWYRTRKDHSDRWTAFTRNRYFKFREELRQNYRQLYENGFPVVEREHPSVPTPLPEEIPFENRLEKAPRGNTMILLSSDHLHCGKEILSILSGKESPSFTLCITDGETSPNASPLRAYTDDIFVLPNFLDKKDCLRFLTYLIRSRNTDHLFVSGSPEAYLFIPYIRSEHRFLKIASYEKNTNEAHPVYTGQRYAGDFQACFDLNIVDRETAKETMVRRGADASKIVLSDHFLKKAAGNELSLQSFPENPLNEKEENDLSGQIARAFTGEILLRETLEPPLNPGGIASSSRSHDRSDHIRVQDILGSRTFRLTTSIIALLRRESVRYNLIEILRLLLPEKVKQLYRNLRYGGIRPWKKSLPVPSSPENKDKQDGRIRILYIANWVIPGGADKMTIDWFHALDEARFAKYLVTTDPSDNSWLPFIQESASRIYDLPQMGYRTEKDKKQCIRDILQTENIDVVHVMNSRTGFEMLSDIKTKMPGIKTVVQFHCFDYLENGARVGWAKDIPVQSDAVIDHYIVVSENLKNEVFKSTGGKDTSKISVVYNGVDTSRLDPDRVIPSAGVMDCMHRDKLNILFVGRLDQQKKPLVMAEVARKLKDKKAPFVIHVLGDGGIESRKPALVSYIAEYGLEKEIILHGNQPPEEMDQWYKATDMLIMTSAWEGIPLVLYEAMSMGLVCIAPDVGGIREILNGSSGFLIDSYDDTDQYVRIITKLIHNPQQRERLGAAARTAMVKRFDITVMKKNYTAVYENLAR